jgi:hypothetical protein
MQDHHDASAFGCDGRNRHGDPVLCADSNKLMAKLPLLLRDQAIFRLPLASLVKYLPVSRVQDGKLPDYNFEGPSGL